MFILNEIQPTKPDWPHSLNLIVSKSSIFLLYQKIPIGLTPSPLILSILIVLSVNLRASIFFICPWGLRKGVKYSACNQTKLDIFQPTRVSLLTSIPSSAPTMPWGGSKTPCITYFCKSLTKSHSLEESRTPSFHPWHPYLGGGSKAQCIK